MKKQITCISYICLALICCQNEEKNKTFSWKLGHNLPETHPTHIALQQFVQEVAKETEGRINIKLYPNNQLGEEDAMLEQLQSNTLEMLKLSTSYLESFAPLYGIFSIPYLFKTRKQFFNVMDSTLINEIYTSSYPHGFIALTYFDTGAKSFFTRDRAIMHPDDLKNLTIRVTPSARFIKMLELLGASATCIPCNEIDAALQTGSLDGAEGHLISFVELKHAAIAKSFSFDEHLMMPDMLIVNTKNWESLSEEDRLAIKLAAKNSTQLQISLWAKNTEKAMTLAENQGVQFYHPDKMPFKQATQPILQEQMQDPVKAHIIQAIQQTPA